MKFFTGIILPFAFLVIISGCSFQENRDLRKEVDSLRAQLNFSHQAIVTIKEVNTLIDSIDAARGLLRIQMVEGMPLPNYTQRMEEVLAYVKVSENKITELQKTLKKTSNVNEAYSMMIDALKNELEMATSEILSLQNQVKTVEKKNTELAGVVKLQQSTLAVNEAKLERTHETLQLYETRMHQLMLESKLSEADAYYARAEAVYEAGRRTKLAPKKKKETIKEALELYQKAYSLGKEEAQAKIKELQKKI